MTILKLPSAPPTVASARARALVFEDPRSQDVLRLVQRLAPTDSTVLLVGETGTGKEIVARHIHEQSPRRNGPFVAINCSAFSASAVEGELFGHEAGVLPGAPNPRAGFFEATDGGTLFLDDIGDLPAPVQVKILLFLEQRSIVRVGARKPTPVDVRLVAATHVDLTQAVCAGRFRQDLFDRLHVAALTLPPLRDRPADILPLGRYFLELYSERLGVAGARLTRDASRALCEHSWPGNIRELENVIHRALLVSPSSQIGESDLRLPALSRDERADAKSGKSGDAALEAAFRELFSAPGVDLYHRIEERLLRAAYQHCDRNQVKTAKLLDISRNILRARLIQYGLITSSPRKASRRSDHDLVEPVS